MLDGSFYSPKVPLFHARVSKQLIGFSTNYGFLKILSFFQSNVCNWWKNRLILLKLCHQPSFNIPYTP